LGIEEEWVPGVHYDLGRQRFRFLRTGAGWFEGWLGNWSFATKVIQPNEVLADSALLKMLQRVRRHILTNTTMPEADVDDAMEQLRQAMTAPGRAVGDGDVYEKIAQYGPLGQQLAGVLLAAFKSAPAVWKLLFALRDRLIPGADANVCRFNELDIDGRPLGELARVDGKRYPSKTLQSWELRKSATLGG
jgi:hypothetical protein